jgi:hypothetical protein
MNPSMRENIETASATMSGRRGLTPLSAVNKRLNARRGIAALRPRDFLCPAKRSTVPLHGRFEMTRKIALGLAFSALLALATCGEGPGTRAVTGGLLGAGAGAGVSALTGGKPATGALIGGGVGAVGGAVTAR